MVAEIELFHRTSREVCFAVNGNLFFFSKDESEREYQQGSEMWDVIENSKKEA